jgi:hypothetical protein
MKEIIDSSHWPMNSQSSPSAKKPAAIVKPSSTAYLSICLEKPKRRGTRIPEVHKEPMPNYNRTPQFYERHRDPLPPIHGRAFLRCPRRGTTAPR